MFGLTTRQLIGLILGLVFVLGAFALFAHYRNKSHDKVFKEPTTMREAAKAYFDLYSRADLNKNKDAQKKLAAFWTEESVFHEIQPQGEDVKREGVAEILEYHLVLLARTQVFKMTWEKILGRGGLEVVQGVYRRDFPKEKQLHAGSFVVLLKLEQRGPNFVILEHDEFLDYEFGKRDELWRQVSVGGCYVLWSIALIMMIRRGFHKKTYGMPLLGSASMLAQCYLVGYVGPWLRPHLFFPEDDMILKWTWRLWAWLLALVFLQYLLYCKSRKNWLLIGLSALASALLLEWTFIKFYQDFYVNELSALVVFVMAVFYIIELREGSEMRGMTPAIAWLLAIGTTLLYVPVVLGDMKDAYPFKHHGYDFMYLLFLVTLLLMFFYAWIVTRRWNRGQEESSGDAGA